MEEPQDEAEREGRDCALLVSCQSGLIVIPLCPHTLVRLPWFRGGWHSRISGSGILLLLLSSWLLESLALAL